LLYQTFFDFKTLDLFAIKMIQTTPAWAT